MFFHLFIFEKHYFIIIILLFLIADLELSLKEIKFLSRINIDRISTHFL